ncbi:MAG: adenosylcobinamide-phosphate synthase CbiB [Halanaerobiaceae bacterium]
MYLLIAAIIIDLLIGDPRIIPHPVVIMGKLISELDRFFNLYTDSEIAKKIAGSLLVFIVVSFTYIITVIIIEIGFMINYYIGLTIYIWLLAATIAINGLKSAGLGIYKALKNRDIDTSRKMVGMIVGRDTEDMKIKEIVRAAVETIAENTSDGIIAPIFFYIIGGVPLAMTYKAVNTLDSMLGYKNERYKDFGWAAARLDDIANYIPARLTGIGFCIAALLVPGTGTKQAWKIMFRDAGSHPSWNAGYPEAAVAGAMGVRLGGLNYYQGKASFRAYMGDKKRELISDDIKCVTKLMFLNIFCIVLIMSITKYLII